MSNEPFVLEEKASLKTEPSLRKKYRTVVIDPPWNVAKFNPKVYTHATSLKVDLPYKTMTDDEIADFPIDDFADTNHCDLFLWSTKAKIHVAFHILEKWKFHYANFLVWNKLDGINHNGVHGIIEFVLYAYRGEIGLNYKKPIEAYFEEKRKKHSQKPNIFYETIARVTTPPRVDLFARRKHFGFDAWGDEVDEQQTTLLTQEVFSPNARSDREMTVSE